MKCSTAFALLAAMAQSALATSYVRLSFLPDQDGANEPTLQRAGGTGTVAMYEVWYRTEGDGRFSYVGEEPSLARYKIVRPQAFPDEPFFSLRWANGEPGPTCRLVGNYTGGPESEITFSFRDSKSYLYPWEVQQGVSVTCGGKREQENDIKVWIDHIIPPTIVPAAGGLLGAFTGASKRPPRPVGDSDRGERRRSRI